MQRLRTALFPATGRDDGLTLIELLVAMMVFAIVALGVAYSLLSVLSLTRDSRSREVASNLAAQEIDLARSAADIFALQDASKTQTVNGLVFTIARTTGWVPASGVAADCGIGGGTLQYKRINVTVTWTNMVGTKPVQADTLLAPASKINDPTLGTILVQVKNAAGTGAAGVTVTATPDTSTGAKAITETIPVTDAQGCTYVLKVQPGTYAVKVSRAGYVTEKQQAIPDGQTAVVIAGSTASAGFAYDLAGKVTVNYATNYTASPPLIPKDLTTSFVSTYGVYQDKATTAVSSRVVNLHPFVAGYSVLAGQYASASDNTMACASIDPVNWPAGTDMGGNPIAGAAQPVVAVAPGGTATIGVPMGVVTLKNTRLQTATISATMVAPLPGSADPGCSLGLDQSYTTTLASNASAVLALPYGTWVIKTTASAITQPMGILALSVPPGAVGTSISLTGIVTLDPRTAVTP